VRKLRPPGIGIEATVQPKIDVTCDKRKNTYILDYVAGTFRKS